MDQYRELPGLWVSVDRVEFVPNPSAPPQRPFQFAYYVTIHNDSVKVVTVLGRKWVVTNSKGHRMVVEADGVVGQFPRLAPGDQFHYNSYHLLDGDGLAEGAYLCRDNDGAAILARIPPFHMKVPQ